MRVVVTTIKAVATRHPLAAYVALTFAISWGGVLLVIGGPGGRTGIRAQDNPSFGFAVLAMLAGPSVTGLLLTALIDGRSGLRALRSRLLEWRVDVRWYVAALCVAPLLASAITLTVSLITPAFLPGIIVTHDKARVLSLGLVMGLTAGFCEELGWTGFVVPRLSRRYGVLATGLIVGVLWSAWHVLVVIWGIGERAGPIPLALFIVLDGLAGLPAFRVLMVWVYDRTESVFIAILMHFSLTACTLILTPETTGVPLLAYGLAFAAAVWVVIAVAMVRSRSTPLVGRIAVARDATRDRRWIL